MESDYFRLLRQLQFSIFHWMTEYALILTHKIRTNCLRKRKLKWIVGGGVCLISNEKKNHICFSVLCNYSSHLIVMLIIHQNENKNSPTTSKRNGAKKGLATSMQNDDDITWCTRELRQIPRCVRMWVCICFFNFSLWFFSFLTLFRANDTSSTAYHMIGMCERNHFNGVFVHSFPFVAVNRMCSQRNCIVFMIKCHSFYIHQMSQIYKLNALFSSLFALNSHIKNKNSKIINNNSKMIT